jgi:DNA-binding CsgD family transcriptional regulator
MSSEKALGRIPQPAISVSEAPRSPRAKGTTAARVGLILLDSSFKPIYCNAEALCIFAYPSQPPKAPNPEFSRSIHSIVGKTVGADCFAKTTHIVSGRRRYICRTFILEADSQGGSKPTIAIAVERDRLLLDLVVRFQLTGREIEAVRHLADGLTSKEIAQRMNISLNTVKTFFRLVMIKMGVATRSGVIGKLVLGGHFRDE